MSFTSSILKNNSAEKNNVINSSKGVAQEFSNLVADIEDLVKATTSLTGEDLANAKKMLNERIATAKESIGVAGNDVASQARKTAEATNTYVHEQPWQVIAAGAAVGFLFGYLIARKG